MAETALITGATSGIGESLCLLFASDGYDLVTVARDEKSLNKQAEELRVLGVDVLPVACDLSDPDSARTIFKRVCEAGKHIDVLVNDAGYSPAGQFSDLPVADIRAMIQVSVTSLAELTRVFLQPMLERGRGRILNMSSMMAKTPCPYNALYGAAKVFVLSFSTALARELKGTGVTVTTACPGATRTNFPKNAGLQNAPAWKYFSMNADETAIRVYRALMRGELCAVTGWYNKVGAVSVRLMPMDMQLSVGEWLIGTRKHPLDHEGNEPSDEHRSAEGEGGEGGKKRCSRKHQHGRDQRSGSRKDDRPPSSDDGGAPRDPSKGYERQHPLGRDDQRGYYEGGRLARKSPWAAAARKVAGVQAIFQHEQHANAWPRQNVSPGYDRFENERNAREQHGQTGQQAPQAFPPTFEHASQQKGATANDPCGGGRGYRAATLGCDLSKQKNPGYDAQQKKSGERPDGEKRHAGPQRDGEPIGLGRFAWHGPYAE